MISTWNFGPKANSAGWDVLVHAGHALDAVEAGAKVVEADPEIHSVGYGEEVIKTAGSALVVELMRGGATPLEACREAIERIVRRNPRWEKVQVGFLAMARGGEVGAYSVRPGFQFAVHDKDGGKLMGSPSRIPA